MRNKRIKRIIIIIIQYGYLGDTIRCLRKGRLTGKPFSQSPSPQSMIRNFIREDIFNFIREDIFIMIFTSSRSNDHGK